MIQKRRVLLGTPMYDRRADAGYIHSFGQTIKLCTDYGVDLRWLFPWGEVVQHARNKLVRDALVSGFDDLIFVDSDQDWEPEWIVRLLSHPVDCVGVPVRKKTENGIAFNVMVRGGPLSITTDPETGLMTAPDMSVGTGLLRLSRHAMQTLWDNSEEYTVHGSKEGPLHWIFEYGPWKGELRSEDAAACQLLRAHGIPTWIDPTMNSGHMGVKRYWGDFRAEHAKWCEAAKAPSKPELKVVG